MPKFKVGDKVEKIKGYTFEGIVVSVFHKVNNEIRLVVEMSGTGMLHVFSESNLTKYKSRKRKYTVNQIKKFISELDIDFSRQDVDEIESDFLKNQFDSGR